jgi:hypothetical protein
VSKKASFNSSVLFAAIGFAALAACGSADEVTETESVSEAASELCEVEPPRDVMWWRKERARRQAELDAYVAENQADFDSFRRIPAGNIGVPMIIFRLLPELFPQIWGPPSANFAGVGLYADAFEPSRVLPIGLGYAPTEPPIPTPAGPVRMNVVQVTCMSCHSGRVQTESGMAQLIGAPNTEFQFQRYRALIVATVNSPGYVASRFTDAILAKTPGWLYGDPALALQEKLETAIFLANPDAVLTGLKNGANAGAARLRDTLYVATYSHPNAPQLTGPTPGSMDAMAGFASLVTDPTKFATREELVAVLPPKPAMVDYQPVWRQADRPSAKWGGEVVHHTHANTAAAMGMIGSPFAVNMANVNAATRFSKDLPPAPYPFDVRRSAVARGEKLFQQNCASCHAPGSENILPPSETGTDPNRSMVLTPYTTAGLIAAIKIACTDPVTCTDNGTPIPDSQILRMTKGYTAVPLAGIWARAPYLHNGSVPTLAALLTGDRPARFFRGNTTYDTKNVGFEWSKATSPTAVEYNTTLDGNSNTGHTGVKFLGKVNWAKRPDKLADLLEYLKTL